MKATTMKKNVALIAVLFSASGLALADHADYDRGQYEDYARVRNVTPQYEKVNTPREECRDVYREGGYSRERSSDHSYTGTVVGGVAGALLGSQFGKGNGNTASTAAGAIAGAVIGDKVQNNGRYARDDDDRGGMTRQCRVVDDWENRLTGYTVLYEYAGRSYTTVLPQDPGRKLAVHVSVTPAVETLSRNGYR